MPFAFPKKFVSSSSGVNDHIDEYFIQRNPLICAFLTTVDKWFQKFCLLSYSPFHALPKASWCQSCHALVKEIICTKF